MIGVNGWFSANWRMPAGIVSVGTIAARTPSAFCVGSWPATRIEPASAPISVERIWTMVVLPAPLGPSSANVVPSATSRSMPSSTTWSPYDSRRAVATMADITGA
jgi:hypothetical protein